MDDVETPRELAGVGKPALAGVEVIERALATMPQRPGVYRMLDARGEALYVGHPCDPRRHKIVTGADGKPEREPL